MDDVSWLSPEELHSWQLFAAVMHLLPPELEGPLGEHGVNYFEYSVMAGLSDAPGRTLPMSRLAEWSNGTLSRLSHVVSRLERRGLVCRGASPDDGRVTLVSLTDDGRDLMVRAAPDHVASVRTAMMDRLDACQVEQLAEICQQVLDGLGLVVPPPWEAAD